MGTEFFEGSTQLQDLGGVCQSVMASGGRKKYKKVWGLNEASISFFKEREAMIV